MARNVLNPRQQRFVAEYLIDLNATQAAIRAGYAARSARQTGAENLTKPDISKAIAAAQSERFARLEVTSDTVLKGLLQEATSAHRASVRVAAWAWLGKSLGMFKERHQLEPGPPVRIRIVRDDGPASHSPTGPGDD